MTANDHDNTLPLNMKEEKVYIKANSGYLVLNDEEDITRSPPEHLQYYYTKYDNFAKTIVISSILFLISWIGWIIYNIVHYGINTAYCKEPQQSCDHNHDVYNNPQCCNITGITHTCYNPSATQNQCSNPSKTISTFIAQILLLLVIICCIILLCQALQKGIQISTQETTNTSIIQYVKSARINCRKYAYSKHETPQKTAVEFLWNSLTILSVLKLLHDLPIILLNVFSGNDTLYAVGLAMVYADISNILQYLYGNYSPCCNPY
eukprot:334376_1